MSKTAIRLAVADDLDAIVSLARSIESLPHWAVSDYRAALAGKSAQPTRCLFVAEVEGRIHGFAGGVVHSVAGECWAELETVGVAPAMQRRGLGRELCRAVIAWCQSQGAAHIDLEVRSQSLGPMALYRELGFAATGRRRAYYRDPADDAVLMCLDLQHGLIPTGQEAKP